MRWEKDLQKLFSLRTFERESQSEYNQLLIAQAVRQPRPPSQWLRNESILLFLELNILTLSKHSDGRNKYLKKCMFVSTLNDEKTRSFLGKKIKGIS